MKRFIQGEHRTQNTLFPETLDDYVTECNPVRVVEVFVEGLDLGVLGFEGIKPEATGRPAYHPATLLKIYIYGYLNRIQSTRRLEMETQRNVELMWLASRLTPDFKTIARFRKDNGKAIRSVCRQFVELCQYRNELACTRVQSQTGDENTGDSAIDAGNESMRRALVLKSRLYQTHNSRF
jgi:transposase